MSVPVPTTVRRRPKDRKDQIIEAARELIGEAGYRNVSMAQIAERVGITAGALYRHFSNKAVLLGAVIDKSLDEVMPPTDDPDVDLDEALSRACERVVTRRDVGALWWREAPHLDPATLGRLRTRLRNSNRAYQALILAQRALPNERAERLAWGVQAILASPSFHATKVPHADFVALLSAACRALCATQLGPPRSKAPVRRGRLEPLSKREKLLTHSVELFERNGFEATALNDIGAAAGVTGPNLYSYFESKADILDVAMARGVSALWLLLDGVLRDNDDPARALRDLVRGYTQLASQRTVLVSTLLLAEPRSLDDQRRALQREYVAEWIALLRASRPDVDETSARVLVHTSLAVIHNMTRIGQEQEDPGFFDDLAEMASAVLFA
jgi:AcrR family transcriptional regulator